VRRLAWCANCGFHNKLIPKQKELKLSGAKKRRLAKVKVDKERSTVATAQRLDRFFVHSNLSETESESVAAVATLSSTSTFQEGNEKSESDSDHCQSHESNVEYSVSVAEDDQGKCPRSPFVRCF
jgi:hypothetical protein